MKGAEDVSIYRIRTPEPSDGGHARRRCLQDYTDESLLITHEATYRGLAEIRQFFTALLNRLPEGFFASIRLNRREVAGEVAYILWERKPWFVLATDTFVVRNGKILFQTFAGYTASQ
jgi:hypothetical protein